MAGGLPTGVGGRPTRAALAACAALAVVVSLAGCGGSSKTGAVGAKVASGSVAVVDGHELTSADYATGLAEELDELKAQGTAIPKDGTTQYEQMLSVVIDALVQNEEFRIEAAKLGLTVTPAQVKLGVELIKEEEVGGSEVRYKAALRAEDITNADVVASVALHLIEEDLIARVTRGIKVSNEAVERYYEAYPSQFKVPASRKVREILTGKAGEGIAKTIIAELHSGKAGFAVLAKRYSQDPGTKDSGGLYTAHDGSDVPAFDAAVFSPSAKTDEILGPIDTPQYGWFVIEPLGPIVPGSVEPESAVAAEIRTTLTQSEQQSLFQSWVEGITKQFCASGSIGYAPGYAPDPNPCSSTSTSTLPAKTTTTVG